MRNPPATASHLSPLHSACVVDMLCPALEALAASQEAGTELHIVHLLEWMKECIGNLELAPDNQSQSNVIRQIIQKSQTCERNPLPNYENPLCLACATCHHAHACEAAASEVECGMSLSRCAVVPLKGACSPFRFLFGIFVEIVHPIVPQVEDAQVSASLRRCY